MNFGQIELHTERLCLREIRLDDAEDFFEIYSDPEALTYWGEPPITRHAEAIEMIAKRIKWWDTGDSICLAVEERTTNKMIGTISVFSFHRDSRRAEIGYILHRDFWRKGFATEAVKETINYVFTELKLNRLEADIEPANAASAALLQKLHFVCEGRLRQRWIVSGRVSDSDIYGLIASDWASAN